MMRKPKPTNPTPMIVAEELTPSDRVMTSGTLPTTARLPPTPMNTSGVVSRPPELLALEAAVAAWGKKARATSIHIAHQHQKRP